MQFPSRARMTSLRSGSTGVSRALASVSRGASGCDSGVLDGEGPRPGACRQPREHVGAGTRPPAGKRPHSSSPWPRRRSFVRPRDRLCSSRLARELRVGRVARRGGSRCSARSSKTRSRSLASARLRDRSRKREAWTTISPREFSLPESLASKRSLSSLPSTRECPGLKRSTTFVATLLTFCPPGPPARAASVTISSGGISMRPKRRTPGAREGLTLRGPAGLSPGDTGRDRCPCRARPRSGSQSRSCRPGGRPRGGCRAERCEDRGGERRKAHRRSEHKGTSRAARPR